MKTSWFVSPAGRRLAKAVAFAASSGGFLMYALPNTLFIDKFKSVTRLYKSSTPVKLSEKIPPLVQEVMDDLHLSQTDQSHISLYTGYGFDLFRAGTFKYSPSCVLGIPRNFKYRDVAEFDPTGVIVNNEPVQWSTEAGQSLKESLVFSEEAKKFAIARELVHLNTAEPFFNGVISSAFIFMCYSMSATVNTKLNLIAKMKKIRLILYGLVSSFTFTMWVTCKDVSCVSFEASADETAANISEKYAKGGLELYEKVLQRNIALRTLMGDRGESWFTAYGNDQVLFRTRHLPYSTRRDNMKKRVDEYHETSSESITQEPPKQESVKDAANDSSETIAPEPPKQEPVKDAANNSSETIAPEPPKQEPVKDAANDSSETIAQEPPKEEPVKDAATETQ